MKVGVLLPELSASIKDALQQTAGWGVDGVQFYVKNRHYDLLTADDSEIDDLRKHIVSLNLDLPAICGQLPGYGFERESDNPTQIKLTKRIIDIAQRLETTVVSTHIGVVPLDSNDPVYSVMVKALNELGSYAAARNVTLAIETGPEAPEHLKKFIEDCNEGISVNFDPANLVMVHNINAAEAVRVLGKYISHTHAKDGVNYQACDPVQVYHAFASGGFAQLVEETGEIFAELPLGQGKVNFAEYLPALKSTGYDGYLTIEREVGADPGADIAMAVTFLRKQLEELNI